MGVAVFDPDHRIFTARFSQQSAVARIKNLYSEVDRAGLQLYLNDLTHFLPKDDRVTSTLRSGNPLHALEAEWHNVIRFTPARAYAAANVGQALAELMARFVEEGRTPEVDASFGGVDRAKRRTADAISRVLNLAPGSLGYSPFHANRPVTVGTREVRIPIDFPFWLFEDYVIDAVSLEAAGNVGPVRQAEFFIRKVENLRKYSRGMQAHAAVALDPQRHDQGLGLLEYIREETGLTSEEVREAEEAEVIVKAIKKKREAVE